MGTSGVRAVPNDSIIATIPLPARSRGAPADNDADDDEDEDALAVLLPGEKPVVHLGPVGQLADVVQPSSMPMLAESWGAPLAAACTAPGGDQ